MLKIILVSLVAGLLTQNVFAVTQAPPEESEWYYRIGGAQSVGVAPNIDQNTTTFGASANWGVGYSCGKFDPTLGVSALMNDIKTGADSMMNSMISAATSAISSLPALILQRANPGLYDLFQGGLLAAKEQVTLATKNCQEMEAEIAQGINPYEKWATLAVGRDWKMQMGSGGTSSSSTDVVTAKKVVENNGGKHGLDWLGGQRGGLGHEGIELPTDMVQAGYNIVMNRSPTATGAPIGTGRIKEIWGTVEAAKQFSLSLLGQEEIWTYDGHTNQNTPGKGLLFFIASRKVDISTRLAVMANDPSTATVAKLEEIAAPGTRLSKQSINALNKLGAAEKSIFVDKISEEIATSQLIEEALLLRRVILMGSEHPDMAHGLEPKDIQKHVNKINTQVESLLFEKRVRKELVGDTIPVLLAMERKRKAGSLLIKPTRAHDLKEIEGGAITP